MLILEKGSLKVKNRRSLVERGALMRGGRKLDEHLRKIRDINYPEWMTENEKYDNLISEIEEAMDSVFELKHEALSAVKNVSRFAYNFAKLIENSDESDLTNIKADLDSIIDKADSFARALDR